MTDLTKKIIESTLHLNYTLIINNEIYVIHPINNKSIISSSLLKNIIKITEEFNQYDFYIHTDINLFPSLVLYKK